MSRLFRAAAVTATILLLLRVARFDSAGSPSPSYRRAVSERARTAITRVVDGFIRAVMAGSRDVDWQRWATPRLGAEIAGLPLRNKTAVVLQVPDVRVLQHDDRQASVISVFSILRDESIDPVALVLHLVATPLGWRIDRVGQ